jgi:rubrerythrin
LKRREFVKFAGVAAIAASAGAGASYILSPSKDAKTKATWLADKTEQNLRNAFSCESQANMIYVLFLTIANKKGLDNVARLFEAIAFAEQVHSRHYFENLNYLKEVSTTYGLAGFGPGDSSKNLDIAIEAEAFLMTEVYPAYIEKAKQENLAKAERYFYWSLETGKSHADLFKNAKRVVDKGNDLENDKIYICSRCGYAGEGEAPNACPICGALKEEFKVF